MAVSSARGMRDFLPRDKERRERLLGVIRQTYQRHGFEEIETPAIEDRDRLHSGMGGDNEKLSFSILKRGITLDDAHSAESLDSLTDLGLRFDLTVPLARFYASNHGQLPGVFRSFHTGPVWRAERPQKGRYRQFVQCDIDILGEATTLAEREVVLATADALDRLGLDGFTFRVNDRRLLATLLDAAEVASADQPSALITLDKLDKIGAEGVLTELAERLPGGCDFGVLSTVLSGSPIPFDSALIAAAMGDTEAAVVAASELCDWAGAVQAVRGDSAIVFDPTLVRGMGYYTGSIVEISHPDVGVSLGGGGRYDGMIGRFLGTDVPAFGVSLGFERLVDILPEETLSHPDRVALLSDPARHSEHLMALKMQLVSTGHTVRLVTKPKNLRPVYEQLLAAGFSRVAEVTPEMTDASELSWRELSPGH
jgi:histidyl-tRNA synthetase